MNKLRFCPFCGGEAAIRRCRKTWRACHTCMNTFVFTTTRWEDSEEKAVAAWNRRARPWVSVKTPPEVGE